jgi:hypothetical protein
VDTGPWPSGHARPPLDTDHWPSGHARPPGYGLDFGSQTVPPSCLFCRHVCPWTLGPVISSIGRDVQFPTGLSLIGGDDQFQPGCFLQSVRPLGGGDLQSPPGCSCRLLVAGRLVEVTVSPHPAECLIGRLVAVTFSPHEVSRPTSAPRPCPSGEARSPGYWAVAIQLARLPVDTGPWPSGHARPPLATGHWPTGQARLPRYGLDFGFQAAPPGCLFCRHVGPWSLGLVVFFDRPRGSVPARHISGQPTGGGNHQFQPGCFFNPFS